MLAKLLRPKADEHGPLVDHLGPCLIDRAAATGLPPVAPATSLHLLATVARSIGQAYDLWWLSLPGWQALWLSGSVERRFRTFTDHARQCGLLDKWVKRAVIGVHGVRAEQHQRMPER